MILRTGLTEKIYIANSLDMLFVCTLWCPQFLPMNARLPYPAEETAAWPFAQDDELFFVNSSHASRFCRRHRFLQEHGWGIPMAQEYKEEYDLKPAYAKMGEMLGMDMKKSLPGP